MMKKTMNMIRIMMKKRGKKAMNMMIKTREKETKKKAARRKLQAVRKINLMLKL